MDILITGAGGRIGDQLVRSLLGEGYRVRAFDVAEGPRLREQEALGADVVLGSLSDRAGLRSAAAGVDGVVHLGAALSSHGGPDDDLIEVNLVGTYNLLAATREKAPELDRFVYISSDAVYWSTLPSAGEHLPVDEHHALDAGSLYGATKIGAESLCLAFGRSYGLPVTIARPTATAVPAELVTPDSVFGRRWFVGGAIRWLSSRPSLSAADASLLGKLRAIDDGTERLFVTTGADGTTALTMITDARDIAAGLRLLLTTSEARGTAFNLGPAAPHTDAWLVGHIADRLGLDLVTVPHAEMRPSWYVSTQKARNVLGFVPSHNVFDMVDEAVAAARPAQRSNA